MLSNLHAKENKKVHALRCMTVLPEAKVLYGARDDNLQGKVQTHWLCARIRLGARTSHVHALPSARVRAAVDHHDKMVMEEHTCV